MNPVNSNETLSHTENYLFHNTWLVQCLIRLTKKTIWSLGIMIPLNSSPVIKRSKIVTKRLRLFIWETKEVISEKHFTITLTLSRRRSLAWRTPQYIRLPLYTLLVAEAICNRTWSSRTHISCVSTRMHRFLSAVQQQYCFIYSYPLAWEKLTTLVRTTVVQRDAHISRDT